MSLWDTAPIGMVIDAATITQKCDASILVTAAGETKRRDILKAKEQLEQTGTPFLGVVLNKFNTEVENMELMVVMEPMVPMEIMGKRSR